MEWTQTIREAAWKFETIRSWVEEELGMSPTTVVMYVTARTFMQIWKKNIQDQEKPWWLKEKIFLVLQDIYKQGDKEEKDYTNAGRPSILASLRRRAAQDWRAYCEFWANNKEDYVIGHIKEENLLLDNTIDEEEIYNNVIYPFLVEITSSPPKRKRRRDAKNGEERRSPQPLFPTYTYRVTKENRNERS